jgi:hypothetical protein
VDSGASNNFIASKFVRQHKIVPDSDGVTEVLLADGKSVRAQGCVHVMLKVQEYVARQKFVVVELPAQFDAI